jgi:sugar phosphate isomerase/epimerase
MSIVRLTGIIHIDDLSPQSWIAAHVERGYRAAVCPIDHNAAGDVVDAYRRAAEAADIVIAEVGVWRNTIGPDAAEREAAIAFAQRRLDLADRIGARCCVNGPGSRSADGYGPHPDNLTPETFDMIVETTRRIIDDVQPTRTYFTLEPMPWIYPHSPESYLDLIRAIDRPRLAVHMDPVNMINSVERYYESGAFIRHCFELLGPLIRSCHAKDILIRTPLTLHLDECLPGTGALDWQAYVMSIDAVDVDMPLVIEHLSTDAEYRSAAGFLRSI